MFRVQIFGQNRLLLLMARASLPGTARDSVVATVVLLNVFLLLCRIATEFGFLMGAAALSCEQLTVSLPLLCGVCCVPDEVVATVFSSAWLLLEVSSPVKRNYRLVYF